MQSIDVDLQSKLTAIQAQIADQKTQLETAQADIASLKLTSETKD